MKDKISGKEFAALLGTDISDITFIEGNGLYLKVRVHARDAEGNLMYMGPQVARTPYLVTHTVQLVKPGRPDGTTVANGAKPKTKRTDAA